LRAISSWMFSILYVMKNEFLAELLAELPLHQAAVWL
jgi:hypothetical protein